MLIKNMNIKLNAKEKRDLGIEGLKEYLESKGKENLDDLFTQWEESGIGGGSTESAITLKEIFSSPGEGVSSEVLTDEAIEIVKKAPYLICDGSLYVLYNTYSTSIQFVHQSNASLIGTNITISNDRLIIDYTDNTFVCGYTQTQQGKSSQTTGETPIEKILAPVVNYATEQS